MIKKILISLFISAVFFAGCTTTTNSKKEEKVSEEEKKEIYLIIRGVSLAESGKVEEALTAFKEAYLKNKKNIKTLKYMGLCYSKLGDNENGKKYFEEALKIDKYDKETLYNYAILYYTEKEYQKALQLLERIKIENIDRKIILAKGYTYFQLKEYQRSYEQFYKIIGDGTEYNIEVYKTYLTVLKELQKNDMIYNFLQTLYSKENKNFQKLTMFTNYLIDVKAYTQVEELLKNYGRENGYSKEVLLALGEFMLLKEDYEQSKIYLNLLEEKYSMDIDVLKFKGKYFKGLGMKTEAENVEKIINNMSGSDK